MADNVQRAVAIPEPTNEPDALWRTTQALKEAVEMLQGDRGNRAAALDNVVTDSINFLQDQIDSLDGSGGGSVLALSDLTDVKDPFVSLADGDVLTYDTTNGWQNEVLPAGVTTFTGLTDTDVTGVATYDMLHWDGTDWIDTAGSLIWNPTLDYMQLATAHSINWLDTLSVSTELLVFEEVGAAGVAMDYYIFETFTNSVETGQSYVDTANGLNQTQAGMVNGDEYLIVVRGEMVCNNSSASDSNGFKVVVDGTDLAGSEQLYEGIGSSAGLDWGGPYGYVGWFTAATAGAAVKTQYKRGSAGTSHDILSETAFILNLTTDVPNHIKDISAIDTNIQSTSWVSSDVAVTLGAGDWLIYCSANVSQFGGGTFPAIGINDGTSDIMLAGRAVQDSATDALAMAGAYYLDNYAGGTVTLIGKTNEVLNGGVMEHKTLIALPLSDFSEAYGTQNTSATEQNLAAQSTPETISTLSVPSIAATGSNFVALGFSTAEWTGTQFATGFQIEENVNAGGDVLIGWKTIATNRHAAATFPWEGNNHFSSARSYTVGDAVDIKIVAENFNAGFATQGHRYQGSVLLRLQTPDANEDVFIVGDPGYVTNIEGSEIQLNGVPIDENATHTGEVTGATALTVDVTSITNRTDVVADSADDVAIHDDTDGTIKKVNLSSITDAGYF